MFDVLALGEILIDFTQSGVSENGSPLYACNPGGAPANVLAAVAKLGGKGAFIGKAGSDPFGQFLEKTLVNAGVDAAGLRFSDTVHTTLAFVSLNEKGDRSFSFCRSPGADTQLAPEEVNFESIRQTKIFHFGSLSMTSEPARSATERAVMFAKKSGKLLSYDPNWRPLLWKDDRRAKEGMQFGLRYADIVKLSETELAFLTGESDVLRGCRRLSETGVRLVIVTMGPKGCCYCCGGSEGSLPTYDTRVVDTTGAGDAFFGAVLYHLSRSGAGPETLGRERLEKILDFANAVGALCAAKKGAIPAMPDMDEVLACMKTVPKCAG